MNDIKAYKLNITLKFQRKVRKKKVIWTMFIEVKDGDKCEKNIMESPWISKVFVSLKLPILLALLLFPAVKLENQL